MGLVVPRPFDLAGIEEGMNSVLSCLRRALGAAGPMLLVPTYDVMAAVLVYDHSFAKTGPLIQLLTGTEA